MLKKIILSSAIVTAILLFGLFFFSVLMPEVAGNNQDEERAKQLALQNIGLSSPSWQTLVLCHSTEAEIDPDLIWDRWSKIENWRLWQEGWIESAEWIRLPEWSDGSQFRCAVSLGFPFGTQEFIEEINLISKGLFVSWHNNGDNIIESSVWLFEDLSGGKIRITNAQILHGPLVWLAKPWLKSRWQNVMQMSFNRLLANS